MTECPCDLEKVVDPHCCAAGMCAREEDMAIERAELGIDGNCGFALIGENLQEGEAEFEEFAGDPKTSEGMRQAKLAINRAYQRLKGRIGRPISYYLGESHPDHC
jgi:hypothetical protein